MRRVSAGARTTLFTAFALVSLGSVSKAQTSGPPAISLTRRTVGAWGIDLTDRDSSVKPGADFNRSQNGAWLARTQVGGARSFAAYWNDVRVLPPLRLNAILAEVAMKRDVSRKSAEGKAGAFYRSFMDGKTVEAKGLTPLNPEIEAIRAAKSRAQLTALLGKMAGAGTPRTANTSRGPTIGREGPFSVSIAQDQSNPRRYAVYIGQSGINLPGPEYYSDAKFADIRSAYEAYIGKMLTLLAWPQPEESARQVMALETRIAAVSWTRRQMRDPTTTYNAMTVSELCALAPDFDWHTFLRNADLSNVRRVVIDAKSAFPQIARIFEETPIEVWQARQAFAIIDDASGDQAGGFYLNSAAFNTNFEFRWKMFNNASAIPKPREQRASTVMLPYIGDILSSLYVARYFSPEEKRAATQLATSVRDALDARLARVSWMSTATREAAHRKLAKVTFKIGYPDRFQNYHGLEIRDDDLYGNVMRAVAFKWHDQVRHLDDAFDRAEWVGSAEYANYSYTPTTNAVEIPAGALQAPFFDLHADPAVNYGSIGVIIGQQLVAALGQHFDEDGRLRDWWTPEEASAFATLRKTIADQYSLIEALPGLRLQGELVADEAVGDLGGMLAALDAYHASLRGVAAPVLDGFTGDQRFFLGRASTWRAKFDPAFTRNQVAVGRNAPPFMRINGPVRNINAWYDAFHVQPGDSMYVAPDQRIRIW